MFGTPVPPSYLASSLAVMPNLRATLEMVSPLRMVYAVARADPGTATRGGACGGRPGTLPAPPARAMSAALASGGGAARTRLGLAAPRLPPPQLHPMLQARAPKTV